MSRVQEAAAAGSAVDRLFSRDFVLLCLTDLVFFVVDYSFLVTLPIYLVVLGGSEGQAGLLVAASSLVQVATVPQLGRFVERLGKTTLMSLGMVLVLVEALILPFVSGLVPLVAMGAICGLALACFLTGSTTLAAELAPAHRRGQALGVFGTFTTASIAVSPAISTLVMINSGFPALFAMSAALSASGLVLSRLVREPARKLGAHSTGRIFSPAALLPGVCMFAITMTYGTLISFLPGRAPATGLGNVGLFFTVFAIACVLVRILAGALSDRVGRLPVILPSLVGVSLAMFFVGQTTEAPFLLGLAFVYGVGYGSAHPALLALSVDLAGPADRASAVATFNTSYSVGMATGSLAMGFLLSTTSFSTMTAAAAAAPLIAMIILYLRRPSRGGTKANAGKDPAPQ